MNADEIAQVEARTGLRPGARRKRARLAQTPVMLDLAERQALNAIADEPGQSRSALIREAVRRVWLKGKGHKI